jgi:hypothetical protein
MQKIQDFLCRRQYYCTDAAYAPFFTPDAKRVSRKKTASKPCKMQFVK